MKALKLLLLGATVALFAGCPTASVEMRDATSNDTGVAPRDAAGFPDAPGADQGMADAAEDAGTLDTGVDAGEVDTGVDAGVDPCAPVARANAAAAVTSVVTGLAARCYPELTPAEAAAIGARAGAGFAVALSDPAVMFDDAEAGRCACELASASCDAPNPLRDLASCRHVLTGTIALGDPCQGSRCARDLICTASLPGAVPGCLGTCTATLAQNDDCYGPNGVELPCGPGLFCLHSKGWWCEPVAHLGESCSGRQCEGESTTGPLFPRLTCRSSSVSETCVRRGREGDSCALAACEPFYACDENSVCHLKPTHGEACSLPVLTSTPTGVDALQNISAGRFGCRLGPNLIGTGDVCVQTGTTSLDAHCVAVPSLGQACGLGGGLASVCAPGSYCAALTPVDLAPVSAMCVAQLGDAQPCDRDWDSVILGEQCSEGACIPGETSSFCALVQICQ